MKPVTIFSFVTASLAIHCKNCTRAFFSGQTPAGRTHRAVNPVFHRKKQLLFISVPLGKSMLHYLWGDHSPAHMLRYLGSSM